AKAIAFDAGDSGLASANVQDVILEINTKLDGTTDSLVDLGNGTYTHTSIDGEAVTFDVNSTKVEVLNGVYTFYDGNKNIITSINTNVSADTVAFDAGESGLTSANVQDVILEINTKLEGTTDKLILNTDGTYTHTSIDGKAVTFDVNSTKVEVLNGVYTFKDSKGNDITSIDTNAKAIAFEAGESGLASANVQDVILEINTKLEGTTDELILNTDGTYTHTSIDGEAVTFDVNSTKVEVLNGVYTFYDGNKNII